MLSEYVIAGYSTFERHLVSRTRDSGESNDFLFFFVTIIIFFFFFGKNPSNFLRAFFCYFISKSLRYFVIGEVLFFLIEVSLQFD